MDPDVARRIAAIGDVVGPEALEASREVYADAPAARTRVAERRA